MIDIAANWQRVCRDAVAAAERAGRDPAGVRIVAVSKTIVAEMVARALAAGVTDIGENYVQEAEGKFRQVAAPATWHLIGHLQRNKAARAAELFDVIHTVDSAALGRALARRGAQRQRAVRVLVEVNLAGEETKSGVAPNRLSALLADLAACEWLRIDGLMCIPPPAPAAQAARPYFQRLRRLRDELQASAPANAPLRELSMGMSDDFEVAIAEGATLVRIGRAIFGERPTP